MNGLNAAGKNHGYLKVYHDKGKKQLWLIGHYVDGLWVGYVEIFNDDGTIMFKFHWSDNNEIGCEQRENYQYFFKPSRIKFGEEITWK